MSKRKRYKLNIFQVAIVAIAFVALAGIAMYAIWLKKYAPTKEKMSGYEYFDMEEGEVSALIILDGVRYTDSAVKLENEIFVSQAFIADNICVRFYYDVETDSLMYSDQNHIYTFSMGSSTYSDEEGTSYEAGMTVAQKNNGEVYINWNYVAKYINYTSVYGENPDRVVIISEDYESVLAAKIAESTGQEETQVKYIENKKETAVRYRGGVKSPIVETIAKGTKLILLEDLDDWIKVITPTGVTGYISAKAAGEQFDYVWEDTFTEIRDAKTLGEKINMGWFQVTGTGGNSYVDDYLASNSGINVISPTWYSITGTDGSMSCFASADFVTQMHGRGCQVWALVDDFDKTVDFKSLYSSKATRSSMIERLVSDASKYGFDGINLDFENVKSEYAKDFLQFVRELSIACKKNNLYLSTDNYKPETYNMYYNLGDQSVFVDYVILMAYDEHYAGSEAGSVASLSFVKEGIEDVCSMVPASQVVVGIPFFTRIWKTADGNTTSSAVGMQTALDTLNSVHQTAMWNEDCGQYVASYTSGSTLVQIWFEEEKSVEAKMQAIQDAGVAGVAEWKLGLEKSTVWSVINKYLQ